MDKRKKFVKCRFAWQEGFGVFSYGKSQVDKVARYILNQEAHHAKHTFNEEYILFLKINGIDYDEKHLFRDMI